RARRRAPPVRLHPRLRLAPPRGRRPAGGHPVSAPETVADMLRQHAAAAPGAPAYLLGDRTVSFGELDERSSRVAQGREAAGGGAGDRVAILDKNGLEYFDLVFGCAKVNAVLVAVNWRLAAPEAAFIVNDARAKVLVVGEELLPLLAGFEADLTSTD